MLMLVMENQWKIFINQTNLIKRILIYIPKHSSSMTFSPHWLMLMLVLIISANLQILFLEALCVIGLDAAHLQNPLLKHRRANKRLREAVGSFKR